MQLLLTVFVKVAAYMPLSYLGVDAAPSKEDINSAI